MYSIFYAKVSSERVVIFKMVEGREKAVQSLGYSDLFTAQAVQAQVKCVVCSTESGIL